MSEIRRAFLDRRAWLVCAGLTASVWLIFGQTVAHEFVNYDDNTYVYEAPQVRGGLTTAGLKWALTHRHSNNWHPLTTLSHMVDCQLYGLRPGGHHFTNVVLHTAAVLLCFLVLWQTTGALWRSAFVAAVFAVHPLHVESVAWISERKDLLSAMFFMLTLAAYVYYVRARSRVGYFAAVVFFLAGLLSKPMLVTVPFVLLLVDYWPLGRFEPNTIFSQAGWWKVLRALIVEKLPFFFLSVVFCGMTIVVQHSLISSTTQLPLAWRTENAVVSYLTYIGQTIWPRPLAVFYPHPYGNLSLLVVAVSSAVLIVATFLAVKFVRRRPYLSVGWLWFVIMLIPVIGIVQVGLQAHADRYTYLPQIGLCIAATWAVAEFSQNSAALRRLVATAGAAVFVLLICQARIQASYWRDSESLWRHALAVTSDNDVAHTRLGEVLFSHGRIDEAEQQFEASLKIRPTVSAHNNLAAALIKQKRFNEARGHLEIVLKNDRRHASAYYNWGDLLLNEGDPEGAVAAYNKGLAINPDYAAAHYNLGGIYRQKGDWKSASAEYQRVVEIEPQNAAAQYGLAVALVKTGRTNDAFAHFEAAARLAPNDINIQSDFGRALAQTGKLQEAIKQWEKTLALQPDNPEVQNNRALALLRLGHTRDALGQWQEILRAHTDNIDARLRMAWLLSTCPDNLVRDGARALSLVEEAQRIGPDENPILFRARAAALAECGKFPAAVEAANRSLQLAETQHRTELVKSLENELALYRANSPMREDR